MSTQGSDESGLAQSVLTLLRFKGKLDGPALAGYTGADAAAVDAAVAGLRADGLVATDGERHAVTPEAAGWVAARDTQARDAREAGAPGALAALYEEFERFNDRLKAIMTAWQLRDVDGEQVINDHSDADYDDKVRGRLATLDERFRPTLDGLVELEPRWAMYARRFDVAIDHLDSDQRYIASPLIDSYHTVWFELHEELLSALGLDRRTEESTSS